MDVGLLGAVLDFIHGHVAVQCAVRNVVGNAGIEQDGLLLNNAHLSPKPGQVERTDVLSIQTLQSREAKEEKKKHFEKKRKKESRCDAIDRQHKQVISRCF